jgi:hypothetical protein
MIPIAELRTLVGLAAGDASDDALLTSLEAYGVAQVELTSGAYLGASIEATDRVIGNGSTLLRLPRWPVTAVALIEESFVTDTVPVPIEVVDYAIRSPSLVRTGSAVWVRGAEYAVTYTAGYAADAYPPTYRQAVKDIVAVMYPAAKSTAAGGITIGTLIGETFGDYSYKLSEGSSSSVDGSSDAVALILARIPKRIRV